MGHGAGGPEERSPRVRPARLSPRVHRFPVRAAGGPDPMLRRLLARLVCLVLGHAEDVVSDRVRWPVSGDVEDVVRWRCRCCGKVLREESVWRPVDTSWWDRERTPPRGERGPEGGR